MYYYSDPWGDRQAEEEGYPDAYYDNWEAYKDAHEWGEEEE